MFNINGSDSSVVDMGIDDANGDKSVSIVVQAVLNQMETFATRHHTRDK